MNRFFLLPVLFFVSMALWSPQPALAVNGADCVAQGGTCGLAGQSFDNVGPVDCAAPRQCYVPGGAATTTGSTPAGSASSTKPSAGSPTTLTDPLGGVTIYGLINRVITFFLGMVGALAFAVFIFAGVTWMTAGSSDRVKVAKDSMKYAVIGLALIAFSFAITNFIIDALVGQGDFAAPEPEPVFEEAGQLGD